LAAPLLFTFGIEWALIIDAFSFMVSLLTILAIRAPIVPTRIPMNKRGRLWHEMKEGLAFTLGNRMLMAIVVSIVFVVLGAGGLNTLLIYFVTQTLRAPATFFGFLGAAEGVGALAGAILASLVTQRLGVARVYAWSIIAAAALFLVLARATDLRPA